jgi:two-component system chemotaxis response regulator CheY
VKILVADDSRVMRQIVIRTLRQAGYDDHDIVEAEDGRDAYDKVQAENPDLVLSDWNMPNMTGLECLQALRSAGSAVPVRASSPPRAPRRCGRRPPTPGALFLIAKPFTEETFREHLDGVIA